MRLNSLEERDQIIFGSFNPERYLESGVRFQSMEPETLKKLIELKYANKKDRHNEAPSIEEFLNFAAKCGKEVEIAFNGYVCPQLMESGGIIIDGVELKTEKKEQDSILLFVDTFGKASKLTTSYDLSNHSYKMQAWWD